LLESPKTDATDDAGTDLGILPKLGGDMQEFVARSRMNRTRGFHDGGQFGIGKGERRHGAASDYFKSVEPSTFRDFLAPVDLASTLALTGLAPRPIGPPCHSKVLRQRNDRQ
jgi:hypothetical protein